MDDVFFSFLVGCRDLHSQDTVGKNDVYAKMTTMGTEWPRQTSTIHVRATPTCLPGWLAGWVAGWLAGWLWWLGGWVAGSACLALLLSVLSVLEASTDRFAR